MKKDIKYLDVPNICFSLTRKDDDREDEFKKQRIKYGFDDSETWSLRDTIAHFIIPRLERYMEIMKGIEDKALRKDMKRFLKAMKLISRDEGAAIFNEKEQKQVDKGLEMFPKIFMALWW